MPIVIAAGAVTEVALMLHRNTPAEVTLAFEGTAVAVDLRSFGSFVVLDSGRP